MKKLLAALALCVVLPSAALAGTGTLTVKDSLGNTKTFDVVTDGSGNFVSMTAVCDGSAAAQCAAVKAASTPAVTTDPSLVVAISPNNALGVKITGNTGAALDAAGQNVASPANELLTGCQFVTSPTTITSTNMSPMQCDNAGNHLVNLKTPIPAGTNLVGKVGIDQTTNGTTNGVAPIATPAGGASSFHALSAASNNSTNVKASGGTVYEVDIFQTTTTLGYLRLYNSASAPTCTSSTGLLWGGAVQSNATSPGFTINFGPAGKNFGTGIGFCLTGAVTDTDNTNFVTGAQINVTYQ